MNQMAFNFLLLILFYLIIFLNTLTIYSQYQGIILSSWHEDFVFPYFFGRYQQNLDTGLQII